MGNHFQIFDEFYFFMIWALLEAAKAATEDVIDDSTMDWLDGKAIDDSHRRLRISF